MEQSSRAVRIAKTTAIWLVSIVSALMMILAGSGKITGGVWTEIFDGWGYPGWFRVLVGVAQVGGGLLLFIPRVAAYGAAILLIVMLGALGTEIILTPQFGPRNPIILVGVFALLLVVRRRQAVGPLGQTGARAAE